MSYYFLYYFLLFGDGTIGIVVQPDVIIELQKAMIS